MIHANLIGRVAGRLAGVPIIINSRRNVYIGSPLRESLNRWTSPLADRVIAVCELARQVEIERANVPPNHVLTIYNGLDAAAFDVSDADGLRIRRSFEIPPPAPLVGSVGRLHVQKDFHTLLTAMTYVRKCLPDVRLLIVGDGDLRDALEDRARAFGLAESVTFAGHRDDIPQILAALDVFTLPSRWEGLPNAVLEAMAAGLPVVATHVGGVPELVVDAETGLLVPPQDPAALSRALLTLLENSDLRREMGRAGRDRVRACFSIDRMVQDTAQLYDTLLLDKGIR
jgi:glycosyltransferase involved in cell wall biosynthesis